jgi:hypothetical protein
MKLNVRRVKPTRAEQCGLSDRHHPVSLPFSGLTAAVPVKR